MFYLFSSIGKDVVNLIVCFIIKSHFFSEISFRKDLDQHILNVSCYNVIIGYDYSQFLKACTGKHAAQEYCEYLPISTYTKYFNPVNPSSH